MNSKNPQRERETAPALVAIGFALIGIGVGLVVAYLCA